MSHYVHHVPGRMRLRTPVLKRNESRARAVEALLVAQTGVKVAAVNTVTGSLVIHYDTVRTNSTALLTVLQREGCASVNTAIHAGTSSGRAVSSPVSKAVFGVAVEKLLEISATALVAALV